MDKLFREGKLSATGLRDYMSHTIKICEYFRVFVNVSVLQYDKEYRLLQAQEGFRWGSDAPHLYNVHLRRKAVPRTESVTRSSGQWTSSRQTCDLFNIGHGCHFGNKCKFAHKCSEDGCYGNHSRIAHADLGLTRKTGEINTSSE